MTRGLALRLVLTAVMIALIVWLFVSCAAGRRASLARAPGEYELLVAGCTRWSVVCQPVQIAGDRRDEEAWGLRVTGISKSMGEAAWVTPGLYYAVGKRARCDEFRAALSEHGTSSEGCWGPTYFRRE